MGSARKEDAIAVRDLIVSRGYTCLSGQIASDTEEVRMTFVKPGSTLWVNMRNKPPSLLEEFCNVYEEIHAVAVGVVHSLTRLKPMTFSEIEAADISPDLRRDLESEYHYYYVVFWAIRILIAIVLIAVTGGFEYAAKVLGW